MNKTNVKTFFYIYGRSLMLAVYSAVSAVLCKRITVELVPWTVLRTTGRHLPEQHQSRLRDTLQLIRLALLQLQHRSLGAG